MRFHSLQSSAWVWLVGMVIAFGFAFACYERAEPPSEPSARACVGEGTCPAGQVCSLEGECVNRELWISSFVNIDSMDDPVGWFMWQRYGTRGARSDSPVSQDGYGFCDLSDVRTDDLAFHFTPSYPGGYWGSKPVEDIGPGRCGDDLETLTWRLMNCERITKGIQPLSCDLRLVWIGRQHAADMAMRNFFGHINPDGTDPFRRLQARGIDFGAAGENLARQASVLDAHWAWMDSSLHRRNILTETFEFAGVGIVRSGHQLLLSESFIGGITPEDDLDLIPESRPIFPMETPVQRIIPTQVSPTEALDENLSRSDEALENDPSRLPLVPALTAIFPSMEIPAAMNPSQLLDEGASEALLPETLEGGLISPVEGELGDQEEKFLFDF